MHDVGAGAHRHQARKRPVVDEPGVAVAGIATVTRRSDRHHRRSASGQPQSPAGPLLAWAEAQGYTPGATDKPPAPYRGYFYKRLDVQDPAKEFAVIAYPAEYGASGIMTFIVNEKGEIYHKNLGTGTTQAVQDIKTYAPDDTWTRES